MPAQLWSKLILIYSSLYAEQINMQEQTVRNTVSGIYQKLNLTGRTEAALYYWGIWHVIVQQLE